ncbi:MAG: D-Ala-D-Ala carboxypeptidase family metallohydrolase [Faecousia sp.]
MMTMEQKQCLLRYLGYYKGEIDGSWGEKSQLATIDFQRAYMESTEVDGIFGDATEKRILEVVATGEEPTIQPQQLKEDSGHVSDAAKYLQSDGYYHIPRGVDVRLSRNLCAHEVACQGKGCCTESIISKRMVETFQAIRDEYGDSIEVTTAGGSGYRCKTQNAAVGGAYNSLHLTGDAFDLHCKDKSRLLPIVEKHITDGEIGTYDWGIHAGVWNRGYVNRFSN